MKYAIKLVSVAVCAMAVTSCGGRDGLESASSSPLGSQSQVGYPDQPVILGSPFVVGATTYTPEDVASYDDVGYASFYGQELAGRPTANGEIFMPSSVSAAHKTLPMPSYVEVTALDTGRTILVRVNDRGPFANDRLIDLSEGAARQLGILEQGVAGVRVRKVNPPEQERAVLRAGSQASARIDTPESLLRVLREKLTKLQRPKSLPPGSAPIPAAVARQPIARNPAVRTPVARPPAGSNDGRFVREGEGASPQATAAPQAASGNFIVQVASFGDPARASALARKIGARVARSSDGSLYRVIYGPYASEVEAQTGLATAGQRGYPQAKLFRQ